MRISTSLGFERGIDSIQQVDSQLKETQLKISSGRNVLRPSDDPVASTRILKLQQELAINEQFQRNVDLAENALRLEDDLLGSMNDVITRIRELTIQSGDGTYNATDRQYIASEVKERLEQLAGLMNSRDAGGEFVFGGFQGNQKPFEKNVNGAYEYQGDEGRRFIQVDVSVNVAITENGKNLFEDVDAAENTFKTSSNPNNQADPPAIITTGQVIDQATYDAFYPEDLIIEFNPETNIVPNGPNFTVRERSTGKPLLTDQPYATGQPIAVEGIQFEIVGNPLPGDNFFVNSAEKQGLLTTIEKLIYGLENFIPTSEGRAAFDALLNDTLTNLDNAETSILETRSQIGARLNTVDTTREQQQDVEILTKEILADLSELDYAEAISQLSLEQFVLEASYGTYSQVTSLSLFDTL